MRIWRQHGFEERRGKLRGTLYLGLDSEAVQVLESDCFLRRCLSAGGHRLLGKFIIDLPAGRCRPSLCLTRSFAACLKVAKGLRFLFCLEIVHLLRVNDSRGWLLAPVHLYESPPD